MGVRSRGLLMVISQEPTQSLAALNKLRLAADIRITREQQDVNLALVIALGMIMFDVFVQRPPQRALAQDSTDDQSCERQERDLRAFAKRAGPRGRSPCSRRRHPGP